MLFYFVRVQRPHRHNFAELYSRFFLYHRTFSFLCSRFLFFLLLHIFTDYIGAILGHLISGAMRLAVEEINHSNQVLPQYQLDFIFNDTRGKQLKSVAAVMDQWDRGVVGYIGPEDTCYVEATMAAAQNLPMISFVSKKSNVFC